MRKAFTYPIERPLKTLQELLDEPLMIGYSASKEWQLESYSPIYSPRTNSIEDIILYTPVINKQIVKRSNNPTETIAGIGYVSSEIDDSRSDILLESTLNHNNFLSPFIRSIGVYANVVYTEGVDTDKAYYTKEELTGDLIFIQTFKPVYRKTDMTQTVRLVLIPYRTTLEWFADDIHWVNNTDFIY